MRGSTPAPEADKLKAGGNTPCVVLQYDDESPFIIDAGTGFRLYGQSLNLGPNDSFAATLLLSHFHWDHLQGFPFFTPLFSAGTRLQIVSGFAPSFVRRNLGRQMMQPFFPLTLAAVRAHLSYARVPLKGFHIGSVLARPVPLNHPGRAIGFLLQSAAGSVIYISDHEHGVAAVDDQIAQMAQRADLLIYDSHFTPEEYSAAAGWGHSTWLAATELATRAAVQRLLLFHHSPTRTDSELQTILPLARARFANTDIACEADEIVLSVLDVLP